MKNERGFTLIEVLVAAGVLGITATALFGVLSTSLFNLRTVEDRHRYQLAAQGLMHRMSLLPALPPDASAEGSLDDKGGRWMADVKLWSPAALTDRPAEAIMRISVTVTWPGRSVQRSVTIEAVRAAKVEYSGYQLQDALGKIVPD